MRYILLLLMLAGMADANGGSIPVTIFEEGRYSYASCRVGEDCKYLNGILKDDISPKIASADLKDMPLYAIIAITVTAVTSVIISYGIANKLKPK